MDKYTRGLIQVARCKIARAREQQRLLKRATQKTERHSPEKYGSQAIKASSLRHALCLLECYIKEQEDDVRFRIARTRHKV
jgi:hypothetical protein